MVGLPVPAPVVHAKYQAKGAYHWAEIARNPFTYHCFTAARYWLALDLAGPLAGKRVLDYGCGDGAFLSLLARRGARCVGLEPDEEGRRLAAEELARRSLDIPLHVSADELPAGSFDVVFLLEVIEHVGEPRRLLEEIDGLLAPGGVLVATTPVRLTERPQDPEHVREYFPDEFRALLETTFDVEVLDQRVPVAALELYLWAPRVVFRKPVLRWAMNVVALLFGRNPLDGIGTYRRYFVQQAARCRRR